MPEKHGFDTFFGYYHQVHAHSFYPPYLIRNSEEVILPGNGHSFYEGKHYAQDLIFAEAVKFIKSNADKPFFCYLPWTPPHGLWGIPEDDPAWLEFKDKDASWDFGQQTTRDARVYAAMLKMCDRQLGDIDSSPVLNGDRVYVGSPTGGGRIHSIAADSQNNIYVGESLTGNRVQRFLYKGTGPATRQYDEYGMELNE